MKQKWILIAIFVVVTLSILLPRIGMPYVFDDVSCIANAKNVASASIRDLWSDSVGTHRYYPVFQSMRTLGMRLFPDSPVVPAIFQAVVWGLFAVVVYLLVMRLTKNRLASLGSSILCVFSVAGIQITWLTLHTHVLLELAIVLGLYGFVCYRDTGRNRWLYLLVGCAIVGPLLRELAIVLPIVVLLVTVVERRWDRKILILFPFLLLHNIFPSFAVSLLLGSPVVQSVFTRGLPVYQSIFSFQGLALLRFNMPVHLILFVPLSLTFLALVSVVVSLKKSKRVQILAMCFLAFSFSSIFLTSIGFKDTFPTPLSVLPSLLCVTVAIISFPRYKLLSIWFLVAWLPFFRLYNASNPILLAASIPWSIMIVIWISKLPVVDQISKTGRTFLSSLRPRYAVQYALILLLLVMGFASQPLNLVSQYKLFNETLSMEGEMGDWIATNIPEDSIVITNSTYARDIKYYSGSEGIVFGRGWGVPSGDRIAVPNSVALEKLVRECNPRDVYVLVTSSRISRRSWLITSKDYPAELQAKFQVVCRYPTLDPLRSLLPELYRPRGGLPDAARETRINAGLFWEETFVELGMYKLVREVE